MIQLFLYRWDLQSINIQGIKKKTLSSGHKSYFFQSLHPLPGNILWGGRNY